MHNVVIQEETTQKDLENLQSEFPQFRFLPTSFSEEKGLKVARWDEIEILFTNHLTEEMFHHMPRLRWIHLPTPSVDSICLRLIKEQENIIVTTTAEEDVGQVAEFFTAAMMSFAKQLFTWKGSSREELNQTAPLLKDKMWHCPDKTVLQVGLGEVGTAIAQQSCHCGARTWGLQDPPSFHPSCMETFSSSQFESLLHKVDVLSIAVPPQKAGSFFLTKEHMEMMKSDSILSIMGEKDVLSLNDLGEVAQTGHFRGVLIDAFATEEIPADSPPLDTPSSSGHPSNFLLSSSKTHFCLTNIHSQFKRVRSWKLRRHEKSRVLRRL